MAIFDQENMPPVVQSPDARAASQSRRSGRVREVAKYVTAISCAAGVLAAGVVATKHQDRVTQGRAAKSQPELEPPKQLPAPVKRQIGSAVKVFLHSDYEGSGVKIGPQSVLTAGHMITNRSRLSLQKTCGGMTIEDINSWSPGSNVFAISKTGQHVGHDDKDNISFNDLALLHVTSNDAFAALPTAHIGPQPAVGQTVYYVNYESAPRNEERFPNATLAHMDAGFYAPNSKRIGTPAMFAGTVLGTDGRDLVVATGQRGYNRPGAPFVVNSFPGASGGPVFNAEGRVIGLSVALNIPAEERVAKVDKAWHTHLSLPLQKHVGISYVQPVTADLVNQYQHVLDSGSNCPAKPESAAGMIR